MDRKFFGGEKVLRGSRLIGTREEELVSEIKEKESNKNTCPRLIKQLKKELARIKLNRKLANLSNS